MMKKILFLTYVYPYGYYNASAACTTRIMQEFAKRKDCEIHCISYSQKEDRKQPYNTIPGVICHYIDQSEQPKRSRFQMHLQMALRMPIYPLFSISRIWSHYKSCRKICHENEFDMVVAQCFPEESVIVGALLKKYGIIKKLTVVFWDNIYGKKAARFIPSSFALRRKIRLESFIAKYADSLISLYPLEAFHKQYGDVPNAECKRSYLGIPSILPPIKPIQTSYIDVIDSNKINILYSGSIIRQEFIPRLINLLNKVDEASRINLIFFSKGVSKQEFEKLKNIFNGTIQAPGYIPVVELLSVYSKVDMFMSFPGDVNSICSKCYEYMSYGHPMLLFYNDPSDVNVQTFAKYPLALPLNIEDDDNNNVGTLNDFLKNYLNIHVSFEDVEKLFPFDTPRAYVDFILSKCK